MGLYPVLHRCKSAKLEYLENRDRSTTWGANDQSASRVLKKGSTARNRPNFRI